jgi:hypothetical protein
LPTFVIFCLFDNSLSDLSMEFNTS